MKKIVIIGASGHGKVVADIAKLNGYSTIVFLDDNEEIKECGGYEVVGSSKAVEKLADEDYDFVVAIGNPQIRKRILKGIPSKASVVTLIHPAAVVAGDVKIGSGSVVMAGAVINPGAVIGEGCIINTSSSVDHDNIVGDYAHISVGAHLAGSVSIGDNTWIGAGATVSNNLEICADCMIGAGAVVVKNIYEAGKYVGLPARKMD